MKKSYKLFSLLALPVLGLAACGGVDDIFGNLDGGACPSGTTLYSLPGQRTVFKTKSVNNITDTCFTPPLTSAELSVDRGLQYYVSQGVVELTSSSSATIGKGAVSCNSGTLVSDEVLQGDGCQYRSQRTVNFIMTSNDAFDIQFSETQSEFKQIQGQPTCKAPAAGSCSVKFNASMSK